MPDLPFTTMDASVSLVNKPINNGSPKSSSILTPPSNYAPNSPNSPPSSNPAMPPPSATSSTKSAPTSPDEQAPATPMLTYNSQYNYNSHNSYYSQPSAKQKRGARSDVCLFCLRKKLLKIFCGVKKKDLLCRKVVRKKNLSLIGGRVADNIVCDAAQCGTTYMTFYKKAYT